MGWALLTVGSSEGSCVVSSMATSNRFCSSFWSIGYKNTHEIRERSSVCIIFTFSSLPLAHALFQFFSENICGRNIWRHTYNCDRDFGLHADSESLEGSEGYVGRERDGIRNVASLGQSSKETDFLSVEPQSHLSKVLFTHCVWPLPYHLALALLNNAFYPASLNSASGLFPPSGLSTWMVPPRGSLFPCPFDIHLGAPVKGSLVGPSRKRAKEDLPRTEHALSPVLSSSPIFSWDVPVSECLFTNSMKSPLLNSSSRCCHKNWGGWPNVQWRTRPF